MTPTSIKPSIPPGIPNVEYAGVSYGSLRGRGVIVTGGAGGIGGDIVRGFVQQGCKVGFLDLDAAAGRDLAASLPGAYFEACDVTDVPALKAAITTLGERIGGIDVLVNNVANDQRHKLDDVTPEYFDQRVAVNLRPAYFAAQSVLPSMRARGGGSIINLGSCSWKIKTTELSVYATLKSAMSGFTRVMAREVGRDNIRVNCVLPGWVMTQRQVSLWVDEAGEAEMNRSHCIPGRIIGADIANMVIFLAADTSRMITAQEFIVDAGWA
jgi:NAD(P)-dependent dehydrogenase (short-subunit alcohol dehydrogenase family)